MKAKSEVEDIERFQKSIRSYPLKWQYEVTVRNAKRTVLQVRVLHILFERAAKVLANKNNIVQGMTTHQIWRRMYPSSGRTSSATFRGHVLDLNKKGLIEKFEHTDRWVATAKANKQRNIGVL